MMLRILVLLLGLCAIVPRHVEARPRKPASDTQARGRAYYERGKELAAQGRYAEALAELSAGYELTKRPLFLFNMAECARALGETERARELYERYLAAEASGPFAATARGRLAELAPPEPPPAPVAEPAPQLAVVIAPPREVAQASEPAASTPAVTAVAPLPEKRSHTKRNVILVGIGLAVVAGSVALYIGMRDTPCTAPCYDLR